MSRRFRNESGFTLIEVMVAALILVIGAVALGTVLINGQAQASSDVQETQLLGVADAKIEQVRSLVQSAGFNALADAASPTPTGSAPGTTEGTWSNPNSFVQPSNGCGSSNEYFEISENYDGGTAANPPTGFLRWSNCGTDGEPIEFLSSGEVTVGTGGQCGSASLSNCTVPIGSVNATVYTFVTDTYVPCDSTNTNNFCPSVSTASPATVTGCASAAAFPTSVSMSTICADARRVTVVVVPPDQPSANAHMLQRVTPLYASAVFASSTPNSGATAPVGITLGISP